MTSPVKALVRLYKKLCAIQVTFGKNPNLSDPDTLIILPSHPNTFCCGICALVAFKADQSSNNFQLDQFKRDIESINIHTLQNNDSSIKAKFLNGDKFLEDLFLRCQVLKNETVFSCVFINNDNKAVLKALCEKLSQIIKDQNRIFKNEASNLKSQDVDTVSERLEKLNDIYWCIQKEILDNILGIEHLVFGENVKKNEKALIVFKRINAVLNSIDRLEVRGRDSAGVSIIFTFTKQEFENFREGMIKAGISDQLKQRTNHLVLSNKSITINDTFSKTNEHFVNISIVYKFAAEIGALGDNIAFIRRQIKNDLILQLVSTYDYITHSVSAQTRWASVGDITIANCHPQDNMPAKKEIGKTGIIHVCLNGDIDNYLELKTEYEAGYGRIHEQINTDTKLIPLQIEHYLKLNYSLEEAFRRAVNDFDGSHAISMHSDLAPGKVFLAQKGSGQAIFVGIAQDHYIAASELYGIVEETQNYIKLNGEDKGQIVILSQNSPGGVSGITSYYYDHTPIFIDEEKVLSSQITSRDIDRQNFPHYFLKEISESPDAVEKTIENKFEKSRENQLLITILDASVIPESLEDDFRNQRIKKVFFIGQGTAGIAAQGCADLLRYYLGNASIEIQALKSSELSGLSIAESDTSEKSMATSLVIAISQSGTTTDTNRAVDMVKACSAKTLAIVNRRDSDLTFKADGVLYTSSGRDVEMSVASTKAFYSQITAGAILGLHLAKILHMRRNAFIAKQIHEILALPNKMRQILEMKEQIKASASRLALSKHEWATVGSGANKVSADEIRIKLSELCYKTIPSDFIEDKKHIDLSSEPLIIICAAGTRERVLKDIIKETAIFHAHKAAPIVITTQGEDRFDLYAENVFKIPETPEHFAPILNTLVGHIWGYFAALAINEGSRFIFKGRADIEALLDEYYDMGYDTYEVFLEKKFRESIAQFDRKFSQKRRSKSFPAALGINVVSNITLLLKYLSGRLPVSDFEIDFQKKGTPSNMLDTFFENMGTAINILARPVDAIKHQAKTITVGTSRVREKFEGIIFDALDINTIKISQITHKNVLVIKNLQEIISSVVGGFLYQISGLSVLGEVTNSTKINLVNKTGRLVDENSRVETDSRLKGTKNIIVREGNVYIGKGRKDGKNIMVVPVISANPETPNIIEYILSLNIVFKTPEEVPLLKKIKALGGKYNRLKDWILEGNDIQWDDRYLNLVDVETLFGETAETAVEKIISKIE